MLAPIGHRIISAWVFLNCVPRSVQKPLPQPRAPGQEADPVLTDGPRVSITAEEVRKLKARVDELEKIRVQYSEDKMERVSKDRLLSEAPGLGPGVGKAELDGRSQEVIWLFVRDKLMKEQENGKSRPETRPAGPELGAWVALRLSRGHSSASLLLPSYPPSP